MFNTIFHFTPNKNWMNDPNGLIFYKNEYHMFFQYNPKDIVWGPMHWGHAVSKDLLEWEELPIALYPDELGTIYSGSCVVDWMDSSGFFEGAHGLVAMFTHHKEDEEVQSLAYSKDNGRTWIKYKHNPVIDNPGQKDFRDPKVFWHAESKQWKAIFAYKDRVRIYGSTNLREWEFLSEFGESEGSHDGVWECPDLFCLPVDGVKDHKKWILKVDIGNAVAGGSGGQYYIGEFDGKAFHNDNKPETTIWLDYGKDFYAAQSFSETQTQQNRLVWLAWMNNWQYANTIPAKQGRGVMSIPRELSLKATEQGIRLFQTPILEYKKMRRKLLFLKNPLQNFSGEYIFQNHIQAAEMIINLKPVTTASNRIQIQFGLREFVTIEYDLQKNQLYIDRRDTGTTNFHESFPAIFCAPVISRNGNVHLQIFLDSNTMEIFVNEGEVVISSLIFPSEPISKLLFDQIESLQDIEINELRRHENSL